MSTEEIWVPLVDEPIGGIVRKIEREHPEIGERVATPKRLLAFRTFAYIRVGLVLGQLLMDHDVEPYDGSATWIDRLLESPAHRERIIREVLTVAEEIAADAERDAAAAEPLGPDDETRSRFRDFARRQLESQ